MNREEWNQRWEEAGPAWTTRPNRFLVEEVEGMEPGRALDLACGEGRHAVWLAGPKTTRVLYTPDDVVADLDGSGLAIERAEPVERRVETPEGERVAIDALVRASRPG